VPAQICIRILEIFMGFFCSSWQRQAEINKITHSTPDKPKEQEG